MQRNLSGMVPEELFDQFTDQAEHRGVKVKRSLAAAAKLWIALPPEIQAKLLNQTLDENAFISLVQQVVDDRIAAGRQAGKSLIEHQTQTPETGD